MSKSTERTLKVASDRFMCWPLKCVGVEGLKGSNVPTIRGTSEKKSQAFGQYSGWDVFYNDVRIKNCIVHYEHGVSDVR